MKKIASKHTEQKTLAEDNSLASESQTYHARKCTFDTAELENSYRESPSKNYSKNGILYEGRRTVNKTGSKEVEFN